MADAKRWTWLDRGELVEVVRTTVAAVASLLIARVLRTPEAYWAAITAMIVTQSTLGAAWATSKLRLAGTVLGATLGGLLATYVGPTVTAFVCGMFAIGIISAMLRPMRDAYRYAGITLAIVLLIQRAEPPWTIAFHRFIEISVGIAVSLLVTAVWPDPKPAAV